MLYIYSKTCSGTFMFQIPILKIWSYQPIEFDARSAALHTKSLNSTVSERIRLLTICSGPY